MQEEIIPKELGEKINKYLKFSSAVQTKKRLLMEQGMNEEAAGQEAFETLQKKMYPRNNNTNN